MHKIHLNKRIQPAICKMIVEAPYVAEHRLAGQFIILRIDELGERIPLTIADANPLDGTITLFYQIVGTTTRKLSTLQKGDSLLDIAGPLGHPTEIKKYGTAICIGGGIGIAPLYPISQALKKKGNKVITIIGARDESLLILENELKTSSDELVVCTEDGSRGRTGLVTDALLEIIRQEKVQLAVAIGPVPMMKAVSEMTRPMHIPTLVSLNAIMVDGTGMCGGCRVTVNNETRFTCVDGPEFNGHEVDFDSLTSRLKTYTHEEKQSEENHKCRLEGAVDHDS